MTARLKVTIVALAVTGVAVTSWLQVQHLRASRPRVWTETVRERDVLTTITAMGAARRGREITLSSPEDGRVRAVLVGLGEAVRSGQAVVVLHDRAVRLALERARGGVAIIEAELRRAEADVDRLRAERELSLGASRRTAQLLAAGTASGGAVARSRHEAWQAELAHAAGIEAVEAVRARARGAEADRLDAESRLFRHTIRAPVDGVVTALFAQRGQPVHAGSTHVPPSRLLTLGTAAVTDLEVHLDANGAARVRRGDRVSVDVAALAKRNLAARVVGVAVGGQGAVAGAEAIVRVRLEAPPQGLRAGMSATVRLTSASQPHALAVPNHAVTGHEPDAAGVWTVRDGAIALVPIVLGLRGDFHSEVVEGLTAGMRVVTGPSAVIETLGVGDKAVEVPAPIRAP